MKIKARLLLLLGSLGLVTLMPSCQSTDTSTAGTDAIMCDKCKTVWVRKPVSIGSPGRMQTIILRDSKSMTCPDCTQAVSGFGKTLTAKHVCSSCGGTLTHCTQH